MKTRPFNNVVLLFIIFLIILFHWRCSSNKSSTNSQTEKVIPVAYEPIEKTIRIKSRVEFDSVNVSLSKKREEVLKWKFYKENNSIVFVTEDSAQLGDVSIYVYYSGSSDLKDIDLREFEDEAEVYCDFFPPEIKNEQIKILTDLEDKYDFFFKFLEKKAEETLTFQDSTLLEDYPLSINTKLKNINELTDNNQELKNNEKFAEYKYNYLSLAWEAAKHVDINDNAQQIVDEVQKELEAMMSRYSSENPSILLYALCKKSRADFHLKSSESTIESQLSMFKEAITAFREVAKSKKLLDSRSRYAETSLYANYITIKYKQYDESKNPEYLKGCREILENGDKAIGFSIRDFRKSGIVNATYFSKFNEIYNDLMEIMINNDLWDQ